MQDNKELLELLAGQPEEARIKADIEAMDSEVHQLELVIFNYGRIKDTI